MLFFYICYINRMKRGTMSGEVTKQTMEKMIQNIKEFFFLFQWKMMVSVCLKCDFSNCSLSLSLFRGFGQLHIRKLYFHEKNPQKFLNKFTYRVVFSC